MQPTSVVSAFIERANHTPSKTCLIFEDTTYTYADLHHLITSYAAALIATDLKPGDRIALYLGNSPDFLGAYFGAHLAGLTVVLVNTQYRQVELRHILSDAGVRLCFTEPELREELERVRPDISGLETIIERGVSLPSFLASGTQTSFDAPDPESIAAIAYTSGTTGRSKGAMLLHRNQVANIQAVRQAWHWSADDHLLLTLPLFHVHGLMVGVHGTLTQGASMDLRHSFNAADVYTTLNRTEGPNLPTMFFGVPTMYTRLLSEAAAQNTRPRPLRLYVSGSAPLSPQTFGTFEELFGQRILERYGMSETLMNLTNPYDGERRPGTVGQPFPGQEARVVEVKTRALLPADVDGEIEVRGPHVFAGYWQRPDATAESLAADGWFRTGDLGRISSDGYFTITGRAKELIITGGYNVYPREVEDVLEQYTGVSEAAVLGLPDPEFGERVVAAIVRSDPELTEADVVAFCRDHLASYKKPRQIVFVPALPRNALGKIQKHILSRSLINDA